MLKIVACQQNSTPSSFRERHKAQVKQFFSKIQKRTADHIQQVQTSKEKIKKDVEQFKIDTLVLFNTELSEYINKKQEINNSDQDEYGI